MFYAQFVLAKKGPLAKIWLAAHWEKKLTKAQIFETDVPQAIEEVIRPKVKMALRTVGHLLLGIVRIYSRKARYLLADTNEAYVKMKVNFRDGFTFEADLPLDTDIAEDLDNLPDDYNITVPEFRDEDYNEEMILANVSRLEDITLKEDRNFNELFRTEHVDDGFGDEGDYALLQRMYGSVEPMSVRETPVPESQHIERGRAASLVNASVISARQEGSVQLMEEPDFGANLELNEGPLVEQQKADETMQIDEPNGLEANDLFNSMIQPTEPMRVFEEPMDFGHHDGGDMDFGAIEPRAASPESFSLELDNNLDIDAIGNKKKRPRKARKLLIDPVTMISDDDFRAQQEDYHDTMKPVVIAPPNRAMADHCRTGMWQNLMNRPALDIKNNEFLEAFQSALIPRHFNPNYTMQEISEGSLVSGEEHPYESLGLEEHVDAGPIEPDDFFDDVDVPRNVHASMVEPFEYDAPFEPMEARPQTPDMQGELQNKENDEEPFSDPFGNSSRGRLEDYGFGVQKPSQANEDGKWAKKTDHILHQVTSEIESRGYAEFSYVVKDATNRKQAAEQFYALLSLVKEQSVSVEQAEPFGEIVISAGARFQQVGSTPKAARTPMKPV